MDGGNYSLLNDLIMEDEHSDLKELAKEFRYNKHMCENLREVMIGRRALIGEYTVLRTGVFILLN